VRTPIRDSRQAPLRAAACGSRPRAGNDTTGTGEPASPNATGEAQRFRTLILGVVTILIGVSQLTATRLPALLQRSSIVTGLITGAVAVYDYIDVQRRIEDVKEQTEVVSASVGAGLWTLIVGAILAIVGGLVVRNVPKS
jgi:hypothetical protein